MSESYRIGRDRIRTGLEIGNQLSSLLRSGNLGSLSLLMRMGKKKRGKKVIILSKK